MSLARRCSTCYLSEYGPQTDIYTYYQEIANSRQITDQHNQEEEPNTYATFLAQQPEWEATFLAQQPEWEQDLCSHCESQHREVLEPIIKGDKGHIWMAVESTVTPHSGYYTILMGNEGNIVFQNRG